MVKHIGNAKGAFLLRDAVPHVVFISLQGFLCGFVK